MTLNYLSRTHLLPSYHIISKQVKNPLMNAIRKILLEEIYVRVAANFPDDGDYNFGIDGSGVLRLTINAIV
jgi:hypothetical protein